LHFEIVYLFVISINAYMFHLGYVTFGSPGIIRVIISRRMRLEGHVVRMGEKKCAYGDLVGKSEGKKQL
jgi:hypothetical protein